VTPFECAKVALLLERRAVGLREGERLLTEAHLSECAGCRQLSTLLDGMRLAAAPTNEGVLSERTRELALKRAFDGAIASAGPPLRRRPPWRGISLAFTAVLLAAALSATRLGAPQLPATPKPADTLVSGKLSTSQGALETGAGIPGNVALSSTGNAQLRIGNAQVALAPESRVTWRSELATLVLESGAVDVAVEHVAGKRFFVSTTSFVVDVVGTQFRVDQRGVQVKQGTVRVLSPDARDVLAVLPAGGAWSVPLLAGGVAPRADDEAEPAPAAALGNATTELDTEEAAKGNLIPLEPVAQRLASARRALASGQVSEAEMLVERALDPRANAREVAEGRTLLAECAVARGQSQRAMQLYLAVANAFPALPAGENALFAGARLSARSSTPEHARSLFEEYLRRYPKGRFRMEAERHLQRAATPG
jgi:TolA-binding protein